MSATTGFRCRACGGWHDGLPHAYAWEAAAMWSDEMAGDERSVEWGVWVSLSKENFACMEARWSDPDRGQEPPYFGRPTTDIPGHQPSIAELLLHQDEA